MSRGDAECLQAFRCRGIVAEILAVSIECYFEVFDLGRGCDNSGVIVNVVNDRATGECAKQNEASENVSHVFQTPADAKRPGLAPRPGRAALAFTDDKIVGATMPLAAKQSDSLPLYRR
jgi:hypothetical protein